MRYLLLLTILFIGRLTVAQVSQPVRYESEVQNFFDEPYNIVSAEENGILLFKELQDKSERKNRYFEVMLLDTLLQEAARQEIVVDSKFRLRGYDYEEDELTLLFQEGDTYAEDLLFMVFDVPSLLHRSYTYENIVPVTLSEFEVKNGVAIFGGSVNTRSVVIMYNFSEEKGSVLPGFYSDRTLLLQLVTKTKGPYVEIVSSERFMDKSYGIVVRTYSMKGELLYKQEIKAKNDISLTNGRITDGNQNTHLVAGTYSTKRRTETSRGLYVADLDKAQEVDQLKYYNYADLDNFFNYMREKRQERIKRKIKRKKIKGKKLKFSYRLYVQDVINNGDHNVLVGEAYYPTYSSNSFANYSYGYDPFSQRNTQVFDGYKYTHAVLIGFDNEGNVLWDNSFEITDLKSYQLEDHVKIAFLDGKMVLLYLFDQELKVKIIDGNEILEGKFTENIRLKYESDEIKDHDETYEGLEKWYGNTFFAYGIHKVKNLRDSKVDLNRKVFFINKIVVE